MTGSFLSGRPLAFRLFVLLIALFPLIGVCIRSGNSVLYTLMIFLAAGTAYPAWKEITQDERRLIFGFVAVFVIAAVSLFNSQDLSAGLERLDRYLRIATTGLLFLALLRWRVEAGLAILAGAVAASAALAIQAYYETVVGGASVATGVYHKIVFGDTAMLTALFVGTAAITVASRPWHYAVLLSSFLLSLYASVASGTRCAWIVLPFAGALILWFYRDRLSRRFLFVILSLAAAMVIGLFSFPNPVKERFALGFNELKAFTTHPEEGTSWGTRLNLWRNSLLIWSEHPWIGTGAGDFEIDNARLADEGISLSKEVIRFGHAHNVFLDALATTGLFGLMALAGALFVAPLLYFHRRWHSNGPVWERFYALGGVVVTASFAIFGLSEGWMGRNVFVDQYVIMISVLASGLFLVRGRIPEKMDNP